MCAFYDGAVVAAVSTLCWVAKNVACSVKRARMALLWHCFCQGRLGCAAWFVGQSGEKARVFRFRSPLTSPRRSGGVFYFRAGCREPSPRQRVKMGVMRASVVALALGEYS